MKTIEELQQCSMAKQFMYRLSSKFWVFPLKLLVSFKLKAKLHVWTGKDKIERKKIGPKEEEPENGFVIEIPVFKSIWASPCYNFHVDIVSVNVQYTCKSINSLRSHAKSNKQHKKRIITIVQCSI